MELCVSMWSVHKKYFNDGWTVMDFLQFCRNEQVKNVELLDVFWRDQEAELPQVKSFLVEHGMEVGAYAVTNDFVQHDAEKREEALQSILAGINMADELDTRTVRVFAGDVKPGYDFNNSVSYIVEGFKKACEVAERRGMTLAIENHGKLAGRGEQVRSIIQNTGSDCLKSTFDIGNFILVGQSAVDAFNELKSLIAHVHVKDFKKSVEGRGLTDLNGDYYLSTVCGEGEINVEEVLKRLSASDFQGYVSLEFEGEGDELEGVQKSLEYLRSTVPC